MTRLTRRTLLSGLGATAVTSAVGGCASKPVAPERRALELRRPRAGPDTITQITVCTRPFRPQGPRIELEQIGSTAVVHNYGHGGSGWSLSWGSSALAAELALGTGQTDIAVIGCGALGLTSALLLQRSGARVTIYAKELPPNVRSSLATGVWSPDSRVCLEQHASPAFKARWQAMARTSFQAHQTWLGLAGTPVEFIDQYFGIRPDLAPPPVDPRPPFAHLAAELLEGITPEFAETFAPEMHNLGPLTLRRGPTLMYNLTSYSRLLLSDFLARGGQIEVREFRSPSELARLRQRTVINATGYGAAPSSTTPASSRCAGSSQGRPRSRTLVTAWSPPGPPSCPDGMASSSRSSAQMTTTGTATRPRSPTGQRPSERCGPSPGSSPLHDILVLSRRRRSSTRPSDDDLGPLDL